MPVFSSANSHHLGVSTQRQPCLGDVAHPQSGHATHRNVATEFFLVHTPDISGTEAIVVRPHQSRKTHLALLDRHIGAPRRPLAQGPHHGNVQLAGLEHPASAQKVDRQQECQATANQCSALQEKYFVVNPPDIRWTQPRPPPQGNRCQHMERHQGQSDEHQDMPQAAFGIPVVKPQDQQHQCCHAPRRQHASRNQIRAVEFRSGHVRSFRKRSNDTHESTTDGDARLYRKGKTASELRFMGHTLTDNRHGLVVSAVVTQADGYAEREAAKAMINDARQALPGDDPITITLGADKGYDAKEFIDALQEMNVLPHVAQNKSGRQSAVPDVIADSEGYAISQRKRKLIEQGFGWAKTVGHMRQVLVRGIKKVDQMFVLTMAGYNLTRLRNLGQIRLQGQM